MTSEPSWQDLYDVGKATLQTRRPSLVVELGDVTDAIIAGASTMASAIIAYANRKFRACFLDGAHGADLTALAYDRGVTRDPGSSSIGTLVLTRATAGLGAGTIDAGSEIATEADENGAFQVFTLDEDFVFSGVALTVSGAATCTIVGKNGNIDADQILRFLETPFDPTITISNPEHFVGGIEEESDEELRDRVRGFFLTQARGTMAAITFGAKQVPGVDRVSIVVDDSGVVTVYVADAEGNSNAAMIAAVTAELELWRDAADIIYVTGGIILEISVSLELTVKTGTLVASLLSRVRQAVVSRIALLNPGETLYRDMISAAARDVDRGAIVSVDVADPPANLVPTINQLIRTATNLVTFV